MRFVPLYLALTGVAILLLAGCGGGSSTTARSAFAGNWSGPYSGTVNLGGGLTGIQQGVLSADVQTNGSFFGSLQDTSGGAVPGNSQPISGSINSKGLVAATYTAAPTGQVVTYTMSGTVTKAANAHLTGTLTQTFSGTAYGTLNIDLTLQSSAP